jgi:hypothetical protein
MTRAAPRHGFQPKHDGWDDLRRLWQRPQVSAKAAAAETLPEVDSPPLVPIVETPVAAPMSTCATERRGDAGTPPQSSRARAPGPRPERLRAWFEDPAITVPRPAAPAASRRAFNLRAALVRMVGLGRPDPLFAALCRAHPGGPPPDVNPGVEGGRQVFQPDPLFFRREA